MFDESPLTIDEINEMPIDALTYDDVQGLDSKGLHKMSTEELTEGVPEELLAQVHVTLPKAVLFHWYWVWVRVGLHPEKAMFKIQAERVRTRRNHDSKRMAKIEVVYRRAA